MGLKSGSRDAGLDESDEAEEEAEVSDEDAEEDTAEAIDHSETHSRTAPPTDSSTAAEQTPTADESKSDTERPSMSSIPYKLRRNKVNEGRDQVPYFLRKEIVDAESELQDTLEAMLGEDVYKSDYREAAMVVAQRNPDLVAEVLREWGYDLDAV